MARDLVRLSYARLVQLAAERGVPADYLERDYVLTIVLRQIARTSELGNRIEISYRESVILPPRAVPFVSPFCAPFDVRVMQIEEIVAEKMRALYQRAKPGDLYDLFFILDSPTLNCDLEQTSRLLPTKFALVAGKWRRARFFKRLEKRAAQIEPLWESALADVILGELPPFDETIAAVQRRLRRLPR